ncbi:ATP-dependent nuclease [Lonsdalea quercina]|uniref:ATP-dependent nuclease n=1 Tax=Lonsdalea quercina TaxID=71657 RepID=UPI003974849B
MNILQMTIHKIKGIPNGSIELPIENGIYAIVGSNGIGKSTIISCLAQLLSRHNLGLLKEQDYNNESYVEFTFNGRTDKWYCENGFWKADTYPHSIKFNGTYEGSLFYGMRFIDSKNVDELVSEGKILENEIVDADPYIVEHLGEILHSDKTHYTSLSRVRNKTIRERLGLKNTPYFMQSENASIISQYRMSSGECLTISLLHFIYNSVVRRSLNRKQPILMLIDEIELALHPTAITNLLNLLKSLTSKYDNLTVIITSHSPEVIHSISPNNIFKLEFDKNDENCFNIINPCYPSYAIRDVYTHDGFDYLLLVEDKLAQIIVKRSIDKLKLNNSRLVNVMPVGGWFNVLKLHFELSDKNVLGVGKTIISVLDGDVSDKIPKEYKSLKKFFLPVNSVEKYLRNILIVQPNKPIKKSINDKFFDVTSINQILTEYSQEEEKFKSQSPEYYKEDHDGKRLYRKILNFIKARKISEEEFIIRLYEILEENIDFSSLHNNLSKGLSQYS